MTVSRADVDILFIIGAARSGTTYLTDTLDDYFDYGMSPEGHFVPALARRLEQFGDLAVEANMTRLLEEVRRGSTLTIIREQWEPERRFDITVEELRERLFEPSYAAVVYAVFRAIAERLGRTRVGTKNPEYTTCLPLLESLFPGRARYIHLVRDGRDVALSTMQVPWGQQTAYACAVHWRRYQELAAAFAARIGPARYLELRYEDLVAEPAPVIARLEAFLDHAVEPAARARLLAAATHSDLARNFGKWRRAMSPRDIERFEAVAGAQLAAAGYELACERPRIGALERGLFEAQEFARKVRLTVDRELVRRLR